MIYLTILTLNALDLLTTILAVDRWGIALEMNPLMAPIIDSWTILPVKMGCALLICLLAWRIKRRFPGAAWWVVGFYSAIVVSNSMILYHFWKG